MFCCCGLSGDICNSTYSPLFSKILNSAKNGWTWFYCSRGKPATALFKDSKALFLSPNNHYPPTIPSPPHSLSLLITHLVIIPCSCFSCCICVDIYESPHTAATWLFYFIPSLISRFLSFSTHAGNLFHSHAPWPVMTSASCPITVESGSKCCL